MTRTPQKEGEVYKLVGGHLQDLADGRVLEPGQTTTLTSDALADPHNQRLVDAGLLVTADTKGDS
jgi:hypothetical protein